MILEQRKQWYQVFHKFQLSRERTWAPKINTALKNQINSVTIYLQSNGIQATISNLLAIIPMDEIATIIKNIYIDAGTVFGGKAYQLVKKQKAEQKQMMPIGYNEELINEIIQYFQLKLLNEAVIPITEKTRNIVLNILIESQQNGVSINDIVKRLSVTDFSYNRSRTIAAAPSPPFSFG